MRYDKINKKAKKVAEELTGLQDKFEKLDKEYLKIRSVLESTMHEVRRFSGELSSYAEELSKTVSNNPQSSRIVDLADNVFYASGLLTARLGFTDLELNPDSIKQQITLRTGIYKKFEKARYILMRKAKAREIDIKFEGNSFLEIDAIQAFELVPFVVLDNALKYSPKSQSIYVRFEEENNKSLVVRVSNLGPAVEITKFLVCLEKGFAAAVQISH